MSRKAKLYAKIAQNPGNVRYEELISLLKLCGYVLRSSGGGSHRWFVKKGYGPIHFPEHRSVKSVYIKQILRILEENGSMDEDNE